MQQEAYICRVLLSVAETALREASGETRPLKCWGCAEIPAYEKDCFHRFGNCPRKSDPRVAANFKKNIEKWVQDRRQKRQAPSSQYGPPNRQAKQVHFAESVEQITAHGMDHTQEMREASVLQAA